MCRSREEIEQKFTTLDGRMLFDNFTYGLQVCQNYQWNRNRLIVYLNMVLQSIGKDSPVPKCSDVQKVLYAILMMKQFSKKYNDQSVLSCLEIFCKRIVQQYTKDKTAVVRDVENPVYVM